MTQQRTEKRWRQLQARSLSTVSMESCPFNFNGCFQSVRHIEPEAYPEIWIRGCEGVGSRPVPSHRLPSPSRPLHSLPLPPLSPSLSFPFPPLPLEVDPLNPARGSGGAL